MACYAAYPLDLIDDIWESRLDVSETFVPHQHFGQTLFIGRDA